MSEYIKKIRTESGDLQIDYNFLANLPAISNPNLLINSDFRNPINQRGKTDVTSQDNNWTKYYFVDRWYAQHGTKAELCDGYIKLSTPASDTDYGFFCQIIEHVLPSDDYTLTVNVKSLNGNAYVFLKNGSGDSSHTHNMVLHSGKNVLKINDAIKNVEIQVEKNSSLELYWVKLEHGNTSTPLVPRHYAEELALCKRYFQSYNYTEDPCVILTQTYTSETETCGRFNLPVEMRGNPYVVITKVYMRKSISVAEDITVKETAVGATTKTMVEIKAKHDSITAAPRYMYAWFTLDAEM